MKNLRKLGAAVILTSVLALSAFAGEIPTPPCSPPDGGQTSTPPCAAAFGDMDTPTGASTAPGDMGTPTLASSETSFAEIAANVLLNFLPLF
jgi:hypothetical protein